MAKDRWALSQRESGNRGDSSETGRSDDSTIHAIDPSGNRATNCSPAPVLPVSHARIGTGERADYLSKVAAEVGGEVTLSPRHHTAWLQMFSGGTTHRTQAGTNGGTGHRKPSIVYQEKYIETNDGLWSSVEGWTVGTGAEDVGGGGFKACLIKYNRVRTVGCSIVEGALRNRGDFGIADSTAACNRACRAG